MNKHLIQAFIVLIVVLFAVSLISESNDKLKAKESIEVFEEKVSEGEEVDNGSMNNVHVIEEDSSNIISDINAKMANIVVGGLNKLFNLGIKLIEGIAN